MSDVPDWARYRHTLVIRAERLRIDSRVAVRFEIDDLVNKTFERAFSSAEPFRGTTDGERFAYLFQIQDHVLTDLHREHLDAGKRSVKREEDIQRLNAALTESMIGLGAVAADQSSPSERVEKQEQVEWLNAALAALPERERQAMTLRYKDDLPLAEIATRMGVTVDVVGGLIYRATAKLKAAGTFRNQG